MATRTEWTARRVLRGIGLALVITAYAGLTPGLAGRMSGALLTLVLCAAGVAVAFFTEWRGRADGLWTLDAPRKRAAVAGGLSLFLAPYLVLTHRFTDAPSGTEFLFLTTSAWGAIAAVTAAVAMWRSRARRDAIALVAGAFAALVGSAGILGNWERPSSFSPFVRFVAEETWMLVAGAVFVAGALLLARARRDGARFPFATAAGAATMLSLLAWLVSGDGLSTLPLAGMWPSVAMWAAAGGVTWFMWNRDAGSDGLLVPSAALFAPPLLLPLLSVFEVAAGIPGVNPLVWGGVAGGALLVVAGVVRMLVRRRDPEAVSARSLLPDAWSRGLAAYSAAIAVLALVAIALPALTATVTGVREGQDLDISWTMRGWESIAVWAVLAFAALLLSAAFDGAWPAAGVALAAIPSYWLLLRTPTHVWIRSLSAEIQQDYGTEYANITFGAVPSWPARIAVAGAAAGMLAVLVRFAIVSLRRPGAQASRTPLEEQQ